MRAFSLFRKQNNKRFERLIFHVITRTPNICSTQLLHLVVMLCVVLVLLSFPPLSASHCHSKTTLTAFPALTKFNQVQCDKTINIRHTTFIRRRHLTLAQFIFTFSYLIKPVRLFPLCRAIRWEADSMFWKRCSSIFVFASVNQIHFAPISLRCRPTEDCWQNSRFATFRSQSWSKEFDRSWKQFENEKEEDAQLIRSILN